MSSKPKLAPGFGPTLPKRTVYELSNKNLRGRHLARSPARTASGRLRAGSAITAPDRRPGDRAHPIHLAEWLHLTREVSRRHAQRAHHRRTSCSEMDATRE